MTSAVVTVAASPALGEIFAHPFMRYAFLAGTAVGLILVYAPRGARRTAVQAAGTSAVALTVIAAIIARIVVLG